MSDNFEIFTPRSLNAASLSAKGVLIIGRPLRDAGFDVDSRYELLFDRETQKMAVRPALIGYKVNRQSSQGSYCLRISQFSQRFSLAGKRYVARTFERDGEAWILPLVEETA